MALVSRKRVTSVSIDETLHNRVQQDDTLNLSGLVNRVVREYYEGGYTSGLDLKIQNVENRLEEARAEEQKLEQRLEELKERRERRDNTPLREALDILETLPSSNIQPSNPAIENQARKLGLRPRELCEELKQARTD